MGEPSETGPRVSASKSIIVASTVATPLSTSSQSPESSQTRVSPLATT